MGRAKPTTVREALRDAMAIEMRADDRVFLLGEEVAQYQGAYKISQGLLDEFGPRRVIDTPITEHGFTGMAGWGGDGWAAADCGVHDVQLRDAGDRPDHQFGGEDFVHVGRTDGVPDRVPGAERGGIAGWSAAQPGLCELVCALPGLKVVAPWSSADAKGLLRAAIRDPNPIIFLENEILYGQSFECPVDEDFVLPIGKAKIERSGEHVTIVAYSIMVSVALKAAEELAAQGIECEVINLRTLRPLDTATIVESVKKTSRLVTVEEGWPYAGIGGGGGDDGDRQCFDWLDAPPVRVTGLDVPLPYAANLEKLALPQPKWVVDAVKKIA